MHFDAESILEQLSAVDAERQRRRGAPELALRVEVIKHYQQQRFTHTYADLLGSTRYGAAARFFLDELYGPRDFSERDAQFARVVPAMVRLFPQEIIDVVGTLAQLHALSERLDSAMAANLPHREVNAQVYTTAWQASGEPAQREQQIALTLEVGASLDRLVRQPLLRHSLRLMRAPARAAGLADLQRFLENGFDTFRAMRGAAEFLGHVAQRERALVGALYQADAADQASLSAVERLLPPEPSDPCKPIKPR